MNKFYFVQLPVIGQWGPKTQIDASSPGKVKRLHFLVDMQAASDLSKSSSCLILTAELKAALNDLSGILFREGLFEKSDIYKELYRAKPLPKFFWGEVNGVAHKDDFGFERNTRLIVSDRAKNIIEKLKHDGVAFLEGAAPSDEEIKKKLFDEAKKFVEEEKLKRKKSNSSTG